MEEDVLCFFLTAEELYIINNEYIDHLVKMREVVHGIVFHGINELVREFFATDIKNSFVFRLVLDLNTDSVSEVSFTKTNTTIYKEWIESGTTGLVGYCIAGTACKAVAIPFNKGVE